MNNIGKRFEKEIKDSIPDNVYYYRFRDGTAAWGDKKDTRFQQSNIADCLIYANKLYLLELKSHKGKSLPLSCIRQNQLKMLENARLFGIECGFLINFSDVGRTFYMDILDMIYFINTGARKSLPIDYCVVKCEEIKGKLKKVNYKWDLGKWLFKN